MKTVRKVCACVVREDGAAKRLLVFEHPTAGVQLPKGSVDPGETAEAAVQRELREETGLDELSPPARIGTWRRHAGAGPDEAGPLELHIWDVFLIAAPPDVPEQWTHQASGSPVEEGLRFRCHWIPLDTHTPDAVHPLFAPVVRMLLCSLADRSSR